MDGIYEETLRLKNKDVDLHRRLRTSRLMELLQEVSIAHTEQLGMGRERTLDKGLLWMVSLQRVEIRRMPVYDELIRVRSWPGETMHVLFPRYYTVESEDGEELIRASFLWLLVDSESRSFVFPDRYGVQIEGVTTGKELPLPSVPASLPMTQSRRFTVPYSYVDLNGHMNNTRYFDLAEDSIPAPAAGKTLRRLQTEYKSEVRLGESVDLCWGSSGDIYYLSGSTEKTAFTMRIEYE